MERPLKVARAAIADNWHLWLVILAGVGAVGLLLLFRLGSLVHGLAASEYDLQQSIAHHTLSFQHIIRDPVYLPYYLGLYIMQMSPFHGPTAVRLVGAIFGLMGAIGFFYILSKWYTLRMAVFGTALFATSSWFLHASRFASPEASYLLLPLLIAGMIYIQAKARTRLVLLLVAVLGLLTLYIPGLIWFIFAAVFLERKIILKSLGLQPLWFKFVIGFVSILLLTPLAATFLWPYGDQSLNILSLFGLPAQIPDAIVILKNIAHLLGNIFIYNVKGPIFVPGHLPLIDATTAALVLIGVYQFVIHFKLSRTKLIAIVGLLGALLVALGGPVSLVLLLPFVYLLAVEGMKWLLERWLQIFPRNPFARSFGVTIIVLLVLTTSIYHINRYYLAWGHSPETRAVFNKVP